MQWGSALAVSGGGFRSKLARAATSTSLVSRWTKGELAQQRFGVLAYVRLVCLQLGRRQPLGPAQFLLVNRSNLSMNKLPGEISKAEGSRSSSAFGRRGILHVNLDGAATVVISSAAAPTTTHR